MLIAAANQQPRAPSCEQECPNVAPKTPSPPLGRFFWVFPCTGKLIGALASCKFAGIRVCRSIRATLTGGGMLNETPLVGFAPMAHRFLSSCACFRPAGFGFTAALALALGAGSTNTSVRFRPAFVTSPVTASVWKTEAAISRAVRAAQPAAAAIQGKAVPSSRESSSSMRCAASPLDSRFSTTWHRGISTCT